LTEAKGNTAPFGGVNLIFAGDFAQLPPVGEKSLFTKIDTSTESASGKKGQQNILGKLLWLSVNTVVRLKRIERVRRRHNDTGETNEKDLEAEKFVDLLSRLREGRCTDEDFDTLNSRLVTQLCPDWNSARLQNAPIIVSNNELKDALNVKASQVYATKSGKSLHWYYAQDTRSDGTLVTDPALRDYLLNKLHSGQTNYRLGRLPLTIGMPVMITQNFDVQNGIVNGTTGIVKQIRYTIDSSGERQAHSCSRHDWPHSS
jgi:ATP-dependent exoDNAse (exonuclease V) alpha subunit